MFVGESGWRNDNCSCWERGVWLSKQSNFKSFFNILTVSIMMERSQILVFQPNRPLQMSCLRLGSRGANQNYSWRKINVQISIKVSVIITFYNFLTMRILVRGTKSIFCNLNSSPRQETIRLRPWKKNKMYFRTKLSFEIREIQNYSVYLAHIKLVVMGKLGFEKREDSIFKKLLDFFGLLEVNCMEQKG